jgi:hypothetical protein
MSVDDGGELWLGVIGEKIGVVPEDIGVGGVGVVVYAIGEDIEFCCVPLSDEKGEVWTREWSKADAVRKVVMIDENMLTGLLR